MDKCKLWQFTTDEYITAAAWSADGNTVFAGTAAGTLYAANTHNGEVFYSKSVHKGSLTVLDSSNLLHRIATGGHDGVVNVFNSQNGNLLVSHKLGSFWVEHLQFSPNGKHFIAAGGKKVVLFDAEGKLIWQFDQHKNTVSGLDWSAHSHHFITVNYGVIQFFNLKTSEPYETLHYKTSLITTKWSPDGKYIGAGTQDLKIHFWELPFEPNTDLEMSGYPTKVKCLSWSADSVYLASNCDNHIVIWNVSGNGPAGTQPMQIRRHVGKVTQLSYQKSRNLLLSGGEDGLIVLWQPAQNKNPLYVGMAAAEISQLVWSPDDSSVLVGTVQGDVEVWDFSGW